MFLIIGLCLSSSLHAKDLGVVGRVYPIKEMDFLDFIQMRLLKLQQNGTLAKLNNQMVETVKKHVERPIPVAGNARTRQYKTWDYDPSVMIPYDIKDASGNVLTPAGTIANPLKTVSLKTALIFYDGDDKEQIDWAIRTDKKLYGKDKLILVNGSVAQQSKVFNRVLFFDQQGRLTNKFKIQHVPAIVTQNGLQLKVEEIVP